MDQVKYHYNALVTKVVDGDTIHCDIDLGFGVILKNQTFRFFGLNTPETKGSTREAGLKSKTFVENLLINKPIIIQSIKDKKEKYGRFLAKIYVQESNGWINVNDLIISKGLAEKFMDS
jgi:micrococcal nuclease